MSRPLRGRSPVAEQAVVATHGEFRELKRARPLLGLSHRTAREITGQRIAGCDGHVTGCRSNFFHSVTAATTCGDYDAAYGEGGEGRNSAHDHSWILW